MELLLVIIAIIVSCSFFLNCFWKILIQLFFYLEEEEEDRFPESRALEATSAALFDDSSDALTILAARPRGAGAGAAPAAPAAAPAAAALSPEQEQQVAQINKLVSVISGALGDLARLVLGILIE